LDKNEFVYGMHSVLESIRSGAEISKILIKQRLSGELFQTVFQEIRKRQLPFQYVPEPKLNSITRKNHQGIIALLSSVEYQPIENLLPMIYEDGEVPFILILDQVNDVRNFGGIARTAEGAGVHAIVVPDKGAALTNSDAMKTSSGALQYINICRTNNLLESIKFLKESGLQIIAITEKASDYYFNSTIHGPVALILGNEENGIQSEILEIADQLVKIPMLGKIESLNVAAAASVMLYEVVKQRLNN